MTPDSTTPRIYVACLACYNEGRLHGEWIDATLDGDDIAVEVLKLQTVCGHTDNDDHAIHDYEGFYGLKLGESEIFEKVSELAKAIEDHGAAFAAYVDNVGRDYADVDGFTEAYLGEWDSVEDYARSYIEDTGLLRDVPDTLANYFDYESFARDMELGGDVWTAQSPDHRVFVFNNN